MPLASKLGSENTESIFPIASPILSCTPLGDGIHPIITNTLLQRLQLKGNPYPRCQIIFSSYNLELLKVVSKHHIFLTEKVDNESEVFRLDRIRGLKDRDNFYTKYISGVFGTLPLHSKDRTNY